MTGALWYLLYTSARNQLRRRIARLQKPRYALALLAGLAYFWFIFLRPTRGPAPNADLTTEPVVIVILPLIFIGAIAYFWIVGADRSALAFSQAEVAMLFPAPVSRRALILYKLSRSQITIVVSAIVWVILLRRSAGPLPSPMRAVAIWALLSTFTLHRLGVALVRSGLAELGPSGAKRGVMPMLAFGALLAAVAAGLWMGRAGLQAAPDLAALAPVVIATLERPPAGIALLPFTLVFAPFTASSGSAWLQAMGPALLILALHVWWVLRTDTAFEEAAAEESVKQAKRIADLRSRRGLIAPTMPTAARRSIPLSPTGAPAVAILWKNAVWLIRTGQVRGLLLPAGLSLVATLAFARGGGRAGALIATISGVIALMLFLFGPTTMRNDLRSDLLHLPLLKTLPLRGRDVVLAQILCGSAAMAVAQALLVLVAVVAFSMSAQSAKVPGEIRIAVMVGAPLLLLALNGAIFTLHNGAALLFPAWVRLGEHGPGGIEATGQMMITTVATLLSLVLLLLIPAAGGAIAFAMFRGQLGTATLSAMTVASAMLAVEVYLMIVGLGRAYDRVEPWQVV